LISDANCDFNKAVELSEMKIFHDDLIELIKTDTVVEKQFGILNLENLQSEYEGALLCSNLTGQDGKVREAVAFKLCEFFKDENYANLLSNQRNFEIMLEGLMDINGNVCRNILNINCDDFDRFLAEALIPRINTILFNISKLEKDDKKYVISKLNFQLYWALEGIYKVIRYIKFSDIKSILGKTSETADYTIREKTAKIISFFKDENVEDIKQKLIENTNYYISRYLA